MLGGDQEKGAHAGKAPLPDGRAALPYLSAKCSSPPSVNTADTETVRNTLNVPAKDPHSPLTSPLKSQTN